MARKNPVESRAGMVGLSQSVGNPVGNGDNTDKGVKRNAPRQKNSSPKAMNQKIVNPVASKKNGY